MKNLFPLLAVLVAGSPAVAQSQSPPAPAGRSSAAPPAAPHAPIASVDMARSYGRLPLQFEPNVGQADKQVRFITHTGNGTLFLTDREAVLTVPCRNAKSAPAAKPLDLHPHFDREKPAATWYSILRMRLAGAAKPLAMSGMDKLPGIVNYFRGKDPKQWHANIPTYRKARFAGVYKGVDMVYYGAQDGRLEYDFVVRPGADPRQIRLAFSGAKAMRVTDGGDLALRTDAGEVLWHRPVTYQMVDGRRQTVACNYQLDREAGTPSVRFALARYDANKPLVIDPTLEYSTYLGGTSYDGGDAIAVDRSSNVYVTGVTTSTDLPVTSGAFQQTYGGGGYDAFVTKLNASGSALVYSTYLGGSASDSGHGIAVDSNGNAYVTGSTISSNFPVTRGAFQTNGSGVGIFPDAFVTKLNASGSALVYSTYLLNAFGGSFNDGGNAIAVDGSGNAYVTGTTSGILPVTSGAFQTTLGGYSDVFVTKLNASGSALIYSTYLGGSGDEGGSGIAVDSSGNAYVTGSTSSTNFPVTSGAFQQTYGGGSNNAFVTKLNASGSALVYSTYLGGSASNSGHGIAVDGNGNAYVTGLTTSKNFPVTGGAFQTILGGSNNAFVTKLNASGSALVYSTYLGGNNSDYGNAIALDSSGNVYVTGPTSSTNFPVTSDAFQQTYGSSYVGIAFVTKLNASGSALIYSTYLGGSGYDYGNAIALDSNGSVYITGSTTSTNFPVTSGAFQTNPGGYYDAFISKFNLGQAKPAPTLNSISPSSVPAGGSAMPVTLTGAGFVADTTALVNGAARPTTFVDAAHLTMTLGAGDLNAARSLVLTASTPTPGGGVSNGEVFLVTPAGAPSLRFAILGLTRVDATHVTLQFAISNTGTGPGSGIQVLSGSITANGAVTPLGGLPLSVSPVAAGATSAPLSVPLGNQTAGASVIISLKGTSAAAVNFSASYRLVMP